MKSFGLWESPRGASYSASSCCIQIDKCHLLGGFLLMCVELDHRSRRCHDQPCHTVMLSNYDPAVIGVYGEVCFTSGNECSVCLGMSINKIPALIAIDLFIHYNTIQRKPTPLHCHSPGSNSGRALAKSTLHSKTQDFRWGQSSVNLPALHWDTEGPPSITSYCCGQRTDVHFCLFHHLLLNGKRKPLSLFFLPQFSNGEQSIP